MPTPDSNSAATPPAPTPSVPTAAAEPLRTHRQVVLDVEKLRELRNGQGMIGLDLLAAGRHRISAGALRRALHGQPVLVSIAWHIARALGVEVADIVAKEVETTKEDA